MPRICPILFSIVLPIAVYSSYICYLYPWPWTIGLIETFCRHVCFFLFPCLVCRFSFYVKRNTSRIWFPMCRCHLASMGNPVLERRRWKDGHIFLKNPFLINEFRSHAYFIFLVTTQVCEFSKQVTRGQTSPWRCLREYIQDIVSNVNMPSYQYGKSRFRENMLQTSFYLQSKRSCSGSFILKRSQLFADFIIRVKLIWGLWCQKQVSQAGSNYIPQ